MRIARLDLAAFGPFSDRVLDLGRESTPGLCVIYGPNEAGKSSALRAIRGLLYGIPHQSEDNFVHRHQDLRVGASLCFAGGLTADVVRRKGMKQTLFVEGDAGARVAECLAELTRAVPESVFAHFYGLDHRGLVEGSRALLEDGGELGRALFGAGLGIVHLRQLIERLETDANALFKPQGKIQRIPAAVAEWKALQSAIRESALDPGRFEEQARLVETLSGRLASLEGEIEATRAELSRCRRLKEARQANARAEDEQREALGRIARESEREASIVLSPRVLAALEPIEAIHQALGAYRETRDQLPRREEVVALLEAEIASLSSSLGSGWDAEPALRQIVERARRLRALVADAALFEDRLAKSIDAEREAKAEGARLAHESDPAQARADGVDPDPEPLARALARAQKLGPIDAQIEERRRQAQGLAAESARTEAQLALAGWTGERLEGLALPSVSLIAQHARRRAEHAEAGARLAERRRALLEERLATGEELGRLRGEGSLPSEADLEAERRARDQLWRSLRDRWGAAEGTAERVSLEALGVEHEERVRAADQLADRLRGEADRVARGAALVARAARLDAGLAQLDHEADRADEDGRALALSWQAIWPEAMSALGGPGTPEARLEWRDRVEGLFGLYARRRELEAAIAREEAARCETVLGIRAVLAPEDRAEASRDEKLEAWLERGERELLRRTDARALAKERDQARAQAEARQARAVLAREQAEAQLARWRTSWAAELTASSLPAETAPRDAEALLDTMQRLLERRSKLAEAKLRVEKMRADAERFEADCRELVASCLPEIADFGAEPAALRLKAELDRAREQATRAESQREALALAREELETAERRRAARAAELLTLVGEANEPSDEALDPDRLAARIGTLDERLAQQGDERANLSGELRVQRAALDAMDGNAKQAELAEQAEAIRARVLGDVRRYAELAIARQVLEQEIDLYRRANQGPLLDLAGRLFGELTRGAYPSVLSDAGEDGKARLLARTAAGREVPIEGLSSGTRDQLFLALRLAALTASIERAEPMPLIADDILIEFDDERTRATLEVLARVGERTQILLFTHHRHVVDQAGSLGPRVRVVEL